MSTPLFSVITPSYQAAQYIKRCYACLSLQTCTDWEWIVVNDGSTDTTTEILKSINDPRIKVTINTTNQGRAISRNTAIENATGKYVVGLDMDDMSFPDRLESLHTALSHGSDYACSALVTVTNNGIPKKIRTFANDLLFGKTFTGATFAAKREIAQSIGYHAPHRVGEDKRMVFRLASAYKGTYIEEPLYIYFDELAASPEKSIADNQAELEILSEFKTRGWIPNDVKLSTRQSHLQSKIKRIQLLTRIPFAYKLSIQLRGFGNTQSAQTLAPERLAFLTSMRNESWFKLS